MLHPFKIMLPRDSYALFELELDMFVVREQSGNLAMGFRSLQWNNLAASFRVLLFTNHSIHLEHDD